MSRARSIPIAAAALATAGAARADDHDRVIHARVERTREVTFYPDSALASPQEHWTETGSLNPTLRTEHGVAHRTLRPDMGSRASIR